MRLMHEQRAKKLQVQNLVLTLKTQIHANVYFRAQMKVELFLN